MFARYVQSALVAVTLVTGIGSTVQAAEPRPMAGVVLVDHRDGHWDRGRRHDGRRDHRFEDRRRHDRRADVCSPGRALDKAARFGVRRADIVRVNRRAVVVAGFKRGYPTTIRFAQARGCPVIGQR